MIHDPSKKTLTPEEKLKRAIEKWHITGGPYGHSLFQEGLRQIGVVIKQFLIICLQVTVIGGLFHLLRNIVLFVTEAENQNENTTDEDKKT